MAFVSWAQQVHNKAVTHLSSGPSRTGLVTPKPAAGTQEVFSEQAWIEHQLYTDQPFSGHQQLAMTYRVYPGHQWLLLWREPGQGGVGAAAQGRQKTEGKQEADGGRKQDFL